MNYGLIFMELVRDVFREEETELKNLADSGRPLWLKSVSRYYERWYQYLLVKGSVQRGTGPLLWAEHELIDCCFVDEHEKRLATFELKGPFSARAWNYCRPKVLKDFRKQLALSRRTPEASHYVVLFTVGVAVEVRDWRELMLLKDVGVALPEATIEVVWSEYMVLNFTIPGDEVMLMTCLRVEDPSGTAEGMAN